MQRIGTGPERHISENTIVRWDSSILRTPINFLMAQRTNEEERLIAEVQGHRQQHIAHPGVDLYGSRGGGGGHSDHMVIQ